MPNPGSHEYDVKRATGGGGRSMSDLAEVSSGIELHSAAFNDHAFIPERYSYEAANFSPPLRWSAPPEGTEEVVLLCEDPDAPSGTFTHWLVTGIYPEVTEVEENTEPPGAVAGVNDFGEPGWGGPRPPVGDEPHRYFFRLYALDEPLGLDLSANVAEVMAAVKEHELARGTLVGLFAR